MTARKLYTLLLAVALGIFLLNAWRHAAQVVDDAYIALRYSRNLVAGEGAVYNAGERVEGFTSLTFMLYGALALALGVAPIASWKALSLAAAVATVLGAVRLERATGVSPPPLSPLLLLPLPAFAYWSFGTLEAMVFTALATWGLALGLEEARTGRLRGSAPMFALAYLTRPEGAALFAVTTAVLLVRERGDGRPRRALLRRHGVNVAMVAVAMALHQAWRVAYYHDWRPNTYYAKVTGGREQILTGLAYAGRFTLAFPLLVAILVLVLGLARWRRADPDRTGLAAETAIALVAAAHVALVIGLGGDSQPFHRFLLPALPLLAVIAACRAHRALGPIAAPDPASGPGDPVPPSAPGRAARLLPAAAVTLLLAHVVIAHLTTQPYVAFVADRTTRAGAAVGRFFGDRLQPDDLLATNTAGSLPYESQRPALDTLGLTDREIAKRPVFISSTGWAGHRRGWGEYTLGRRPRVILFYNTAGSRDPFYLGDRELVELPGFRFFYRLKTATLPPLRDRLSWPAARYVGFPFGTHPSGRIVSPDLGLVARFFERPLPYTVFEQGPITVTYFERDQRDDALWAVPGVPSRDRVAEFVEAVAARWAEQPRPAPQDPEARVQVEAQCDLALRAIERGDLDAARGLLAAAAAANGRARSPKVYRYIANLAAMTADLHTALGAQKELVRLEPGDALARRNLAHLLVVPSAEFSSRAPG